MSVTSPAAMPTNSTTRIVAVIDALVRAPDGTVGVRELTAQLGMSRSATHRILATLSELGVARTLESGRYENTAEISAWAAFLAQRHPLMIAAPPIMRTLSDEVGEAVHMLTATAHPAVGMFIATAAGRHAVQHTVAKGATTPVTQGAAGKALLAAYDPARSDPVLAELETEEPQQARRLRAELRRISKRGFAVSKSELLSDTAGVAAAFYRWGSAAGSLTISMPAYRHRAADDDERGRLVMDAADRLTRQLAALDDASS